MNNLPQIPKLKRLAEKLGTPLKSVDFVGKGIQFIYQVGHSYDAVYNEDADKGISDEIKRLENNIRELERLAREI